MMRSLVFVVVGAGSLGACGDNLNPAVIDARVDSPPADVAPDGPCGTGRLVTGELVDLDSTPAAFMGVNDALFTQRGGAATDRTAPNGRFEMCVPSTTTYLFDVDAPGDRLDSIAYFEPEAIENALQPISFRTMTAARALTFYTERTLVFDVTKAHVLVVVVGDRSALTLGGGSHGTVQAANDDAQPGVHTWSAGASGRYVLFPNVDPAAGMVTISGDLSGPHTVPVEAGKLTQAALSWVFLP